MDADVITSRLRPPQALLELVRRDRLLQKLSSTAAPLLVVAAPAGYGKTVLLAQWSAEAGVPVAWLQADPADDDPVEFVQYLAATLGGVLDLDPAVAAGLAAAPPPLEKRVIPALVTSVAAAAPFVLIVDDVHLLTNAACWQVLAALLDQLPPGARLCLSGRTQPPLSLARLRADGRLHQLDGSDLALRPAEADQVLRLHGVTADDESLLALAQATEGWVVGLRLAAMADEGAPAEQVLARVLGSRGDIAGYFGSEILARQPAPVARFLLQTSILERFSAGLSRAVTGDPAAADVLSAVTRSDLFVSALDDSGEWFRYHHLFAEFLESRLERQSEIEAAELHRRAAAWFEEHGDLEEAVRHWLRGDDPGRAGRVVCRAHMHFAHLARYETLRRWLEMFTDEQILADQALTLAAGAIGSMAGDTPRSRLWLKAAFDLRVGDGMWPDAPVPLRAMHAWLRAAFAPDGVGRMLEDARAAFELSDSAPASERAAALTQLGIALWLSGDPDSALELLRQGEQVGAVGNVLARITAAGYQALILEDKGDWSAAAPLTEAGLHWAEETGLAVGIPVFPVMLAQVRREARSGDRRAVGWIDQLTEFASRGTTATFMALLCDVLLGEVLLELGEAHEASLRMQQGLLRTASWPDAGSLGPRLDRLRDRVARSLLLEPLTPAERRVLQLLPTELSLRQIGSDLYLSHETVRSHAQAVYAKLGVHSRSEAVLRAREAGLLGPR